ncbi:MerR family transcriptional regulator [Ethanoligenens harbinense]|uniref:Transcriptional regulator, MerR family n=1 Tax=Ethanoligenens harbinense (strain DSM 18485 / JCM 12961 / CGMCC 1.5033 / YUAN-3) TaxID=663278 RepID=E6U2X4_ETHHY|nr:MerR family transcriptional regulator [Ethanoligenens harbinense]ADU26341.1 transcriptional regulator, MerR family [Ethanoligenens harbinense YUAN-3]AVQ95473.1 MerR family transcriptional regulator [Ethanoligenens harbinense YUAN-3]AYF38138.1 MerR family transcriptional regulator [Ethanoligenens harbinense]AYF40883.1 MerR family transcriptional regulator [Ethanoligenens harbinense]QCN91714.1 MerR family transcriptional regulator [Ethanoligenens harbinense]
MDFSIAQAAKITGLAAHTLRYYEREGLLPRLRRDSTGNRLFDENALETLLFICCLKKTGMSIQAIRVFMDSRKDESAGLHGRVAILEQHRRDVLKRIAAFEENLATIDEKLSYYRQAAAAADSGEPIPPCGLCALHKKQVHLAAESRQ